MLGLDWVGYLVDSRIYSRKGIVDITVDHGSVVSLVSFSLVSRSIVWELPGYSSLHVWWTFPTVDSFGCQGLSLIE